jgi:hypothetical protein
MRSGNWSAAGTRAQRQCQRMRDVYPEDSRTRIHIKEFKYFNPANGFKSLGNMFRDVRHGSGSRILIFLPILDPGSRCQKGTGSRIRIRNTACLVLCISA